MQLLATFITSVFTVALELSIPHTPTIAFAEHSYAHYDIYRNRVEEMDDISTLVHFPEKNLRY